ncbi:MAG: hypothetical protein ISR00_04385 [Flavobacteriales bacterium]|nr:hypothetical protein [Flavobacteriales bacterium]
MIKYLVSILMLMSVVCQSQTFRVPDNVLSTSLYQPFASIEGYTLAFERLLDPGYSRNAAQFSYKVNVTLLSDKRKAEVANIDGQPFYDPDAFRYNGFMLVPELKYYFTWDAPMGVYLNLFGTYSTYTESYTDENVNSNGDYDKKISELGRGLGAGIQYIIFRNITMDIVGGYHLKDISSKTKPINSDEFTSNPDFKTDKLYLNIYLGLNF